VVVVDILVSVWSFPLSLHHVMVCNWLFNGSCPLPPDAHSENYEMKDKCGHVKILTEVHILFQNYDSVDSL
jgi:hypothetical protein